MLHSEMVQSPRDWGEIVSLRALIGVLSGGRRGDNGVLPFRTQEDIFWGFNRFFKTRFVEVRRR